MGSVDDLEVLFRQHRARLVRLAHLLTGSPGLGEEIVQEASITVFEKRAVINDLVPYLRQVVVNSCHSETRRRGLERSKLELVARQTQHSLTIPSPEIDEVSEQLAVLTPKQRCALVLRFYENLSTNGTAEAMSVRPGSSVARIFLSCVEAPQRSKLKHGVIAAPHERMREDHYRRGPS